MPAPESAWGEAMIAEVAAIESDWEALRWSLGCLRTAVMMSLASPVARHGFIRFVVVLFVLGWTFNPLSLAALGLSYRFGGLDLLQKLPWKLVSPDFAMLVRLFDTGLSPAMFALATGALYLVGAVALLRKKFTAAGEILLIGFALNALCWLVGIFHANPVFAVDPVVAFQAMIELGVRFGVVCWIWCTRKFESVRA